MMNKAFWFLLFIQITGDTFSQSKTDSIANWTAHFQSTVVYQHQVLSKQNIQVQIV